jgi:hypothetical protein
MSNVLEQEHCPNLFSTYRYFLVLYFVACYLGWEIRFVAFGKEGVTLNNGRKLPLRPYVRYVRSTKAQKKGGREADLVLN